MLTFNWTSTWDIVTNVLGSVVLVASAVGVFYALWRWLHVRVLPPTPEPVLVTIELTDLHLSAVETETDGERHIQRAGSLSPRVWNKDSAQVRDVTAGARRTDTGQEHTFAGFHVPLLGAGEPKLLGHQPLPDHMLEGLTPENERQLVELWVRYTTLDGKRWEVVFNRVARAESYRLLDPS